MMNKICLLIICICAWVIFAGSAFSVPADMLLRPNPDSTIQLDEYKQEARVTAVRAVNVNFSMLEEGEVAQIHLNLFDDKILVVEHVKTYRYDSMDGYVWTGIATDPLRSRVTLAVTDGVLEGIVQQNGRDIYRMQYTDDTYIVKAIDPKPAEIMPLTNDTLARSVPSTDRQTRSASAPHELALPISVKDVRSSTQMSQNHVELVTQRSMADEDGGNVCVNNWETGEVIDVLVAYTSEALTLSGQGIPNGAWSLDGSWMDQYFETILNEANTISGVDFRWNLADIVKLDGYTEADTVQEDREILLNPNGILSGLHAKRDAVQADLVILIVGETGSASDDGGACGVASILNTDGLSLDSGENDYRASYAFAIAALDYADTADGGGRGCSIHTIAHELGHLLGNEHDSVNRGNDEPPMFPYSLGYVSPLHNFYTLMAYGNDENGCAGCTQIPMWSTPNRTYNGNVVGSTDANNVSSMNQVAQQIANFRTYCERPTLVINEADIDTPTIDDVEFIELKNVTNEPLNLGDYTIQLWNDNNSSTPYETIALDNGTLAPGDYFVMCSNPHLLPEGSCDQDLDRTYSDVTDPAAGWILNGSPSAITLIDKSAWPTVVVDALSYGGTLEPHAELTGTVSANGSDDISLSRLVDGADTNQNFIDWGYACKTPGEKNADRAAACGLAIDDPTIIATDGPLKPGDMIDYQLTIENTGTTGGSTTISSDFSPHIENVSCTAETTWYEYATGTPVDLGTVTIDSTTCKNALGNESGVFDATTNPATSTSPVECTFELPDGRIDHWDAKWGWEPVTCTSGVCKNDTFEKIEIEAYNGEIFQIPIEIDSENATERGQILTINNVYGFSGYPSQTGGGKTWKWRFYEKNSVNNLGQELLFNANPTTGFVELPQITVYGYPPQKVRGPSDSVNLPQGYLDWLGVGQTIGVRCTGTVAQSACEGDGSDLVSLARATIKDGEEVQSNKLITSVLCESDLEITVTDPIDPLPLVVDQSDFENLISWDVIVVNNGPAAARNVIVQDAFPSYVVPKTFSSPAGEICALNSTNTILTCSLDTLPPGDELALTFKGVLNGAIPSTIENTFTVSSNNDDPNQNNNSSSEETGTYIDGTPTPPITPPPTTPPPTTPPPTTPPPTTPPPTTPPPTTPPPTTPPPTTPPPTTPPPTTPPPTTPPPITLPPTTPPPTATPCSPTPDDSCINLSVMLRGEGTAAPTSSLILWLLVTMSITLLLWKTTTKRKHL